MDFIDIFLHVGLITAALVAYLILFRKSSPPKFKGSYRVPGWNHYLKLLMAKAAVKRWKSGRKPTTPVETPRLGQFEGWDEFSLRTTAADGSTVLLGIRKLCHNQVLAEVTAYVKLPDGTAYTLSQHPDTVVGPFENIEKGWSAGGLKIEVLEYQLRLRIIFNGLLKREADGVTQHARFNFIWVAGTDPVQFPEDWSDELAAQALALEPWRDPYWRNLLGTRDEGSWLQFGALQGRFEAYTSEGLTDRSEYLRLRGTKERHWSPLGYKGLRRSLNLSVMAQDGTLVRLTGFSYRNVLTKGFYGWVRFPDCTVHSITGTDLEFENFCETPDSVPATQTINVSTQKHSIKLVLHINKDGGKLLSGVPYQHEVYYRTVNLDIDGENGTGLLELGYGSTGKSSPEVHIPSIHLRWARASEVGSVGYCAAFEEPAARCTDYVGGKGASLALLASVQKEMGYKVPPGYCLTVKALRKQLDANPQLMAAIKDIEAANENYDENNFRDKCDKASTLIAKTDVVKEVRDEILDYLKDLRKKALEQYLGPELRFAVRSSAVGEDSEALSAAGQNETILGCVSDDDVIQGVQRCWGSMFAFTSAYYRRQNGQQCLCEGAVVVQTLVSPDAAGVMFTRHPALGDPTRLLITANYGLGESVVSGSVEPDTIVVSRGKELAIAKLELGSKKQRIMSSTKGVTTVDVSESERQLPCVSVSTALELARIGARQEAAWRAGRDIEWAVVQDEIYLLQARPITSLERWTEEELLHELDTAVMADDELTTFANTGEVFPKPVSALGYDLVGEPLSAVVAETVGTSGAHDVAIAWTHNRATLNLYNSTYRCVPKEISVSVHMMDMAIYGHKQADQSTIDTALHRRPYTAFKQFRQIIDAFLYIAKSKYSMNDAIKAVKNIDLDLSTEEPASLLENIASEVHVVRRCAADHSVTSGGSSTSQMIAMSVLIEGATDFTTEHSYEINTLLSSGGVLSAEVPLALDKLARLLEESGKAEEFRKQDPKKALYWLEDNLPKVYQHVKQFLEDHGHRAIMEFDIATKPWALVPEDLMQVLQSMRWSDDHRPKQKTEEEIIAALKTPKKGSTRKVLRWVLPLCRHTVRCRENTKAHLILAIHKLRMALRHLGKIMVKQWYLPEVDLVFHFRLQELRDYLQTRDPVLLKKAIQRRQYHPSWCKLKFAETQKGWPVPLKSTGPRVTAGGASLQATAVCGGEVLARACVVRDLAEIGQLQRGDVLITHSTDIGWSPYFPLISGIVTELGGLISHGAVIAREYGLPCLVGAAGATDMFVTGDTVRLDANKGLIEKVELNPPSDEANSPTDKSAILNGNLNPATVSDNLKTELVSANSENISVSGNLGTEEVSRNVENGHVSDNSETVQISDSLNTQPTQNGNVNDNFQTVSVSDSLLTAPVSGNFENGHANDNFGTVPVSDSLETLLLPDNFKTITVSETLEKVPLVPAVSKNFEAVQVSDNLKTESLSDNFKTITVSETLEKMPLLPVFDNLETVSVSDNLETVPVTDNSETQPLITI